MHRQVEKPGRRQGEEMPGPRPGAGRRAPSSTVSSGGGQPKSCDADRCPLGSHRRIGAEQQRFQLLIRSGSGGGTHGFLTWLTGLLDLTDRDVSDRPRRPAPAAPPRPHLALGQPDHRRHRQAARPDPRLTSRILPRKKGQPGTQRNPVNPARQPGHQARRTLKRGSQPLHQATDPRSRKIEASLGLSRG